jgi:hypothetical protein
MVLEVRAHASQISDKRNPMVYQLCSWADATQLNDKRGRGRGRGKGRKTSR